MTLDGGSGVPLAGPPHAMGLRLQAGALEALAPRLHAAYRPSPWSASTASPPVSFKS